MSGIIVNGSSLPNIPWEERPALSNPEKELMWRYSRNPIIPRNLPYIQTAFSTARLCRITAHLRAYSAAMIPSVT